MLCRHVCFVSNNVVADECDHVVLDKAALCMLIPYVYNKSVTNQCCVYNKLMHDVAKEIKFRSH